MAIEEVDSAPTVDSFQPLAEHQAQTPSTFFGGPPVLYLHAPKAKILVSKSQFEETPVLKRLLASQSADGTEESDEVAIYNVDVWVSSRSVPFSTNPKAFLPLTGSI